LTAKGRDRLLPVMSLWFRSLLPLAAVLISSCGSNGWHVLGSSPVNDWRSAVAAQTAQLGSRNWIVITEASFPAQSRIGVKQIVANEEIPVVVDDVLRTLEQTEHVRPKVYLNREMRSVENDYAPGIDEFRKNLKNALHAHETTELEQQSLFTLIQDVTKSYQVLVIRTSTALPYTSVYLELQPGYWDVEAEDRLRERIERQRLEKLARPLP
jgi:D-ribose pyranose/furanose isomerase RbsD